MAKLVKKADRHVENILPNVRRIADLLANFKAIDVRAYDVRGLTIIADCFIMCSAGSVPQFKAMYNGVREGMKEIGVAPLHEEGAAASHWIVLDYGTIIVHLFRGEAREFYDLDGLWADAPLIPLDLDD